MPRRGLDSLRLMPGCSTTLTSAVPSLKGGRKARGNCQAANPAHSTATAGSPMVKAGRAKHQRKPRSWLRFSTRTSPLSVWASRRMRGSSQ